MKLNLEKTDRLSKSIVKIIISSMPYGILKGDIDKFRMMSYTTLMMKDFKDITLELRMIQASVNRGSRLGAKTSVQGKP